MFDVVFLYRASPCRLFGNVMAGKGRLAEICFGLSTIRHLELTLRNLVHNLLDVNFLPVSIASRTDNFSHADGAVFGMRLKAMKAMKGLKAVEAIEGG